MTLSFGCTLERQKAVYELNFATVKEVTLVPGDNVDRTIIECPAGKKCCSAPLAATYEKPRKLSETAARTQFWFVSCYFNVVNY